MSQARLPVRDRHRGAAAEIAVHARAGVRRRRQRRDSQRPRSTHGDVEWFATPRRLAVRVHGVAEQQPDQEIKRQGPAVANAFDAAGQPTQGGARDSPRPAASASRSCSRSTGPKGRVLQFVGTQEGRADARRCCPASSRRRSTHCRSRDACAGAQASRSSCDPCTGSSCCSASTVVDAEILGVARRQASRGHRFHAPQPTRDRESGEVSANAAARRATSSRTSPSVASASASGVTALAQSLGGHAVIDDALLDEVTALVEWPVPLAGRFDERFLAAAAGSADRDDAGSSALFPGARRATGKLMNDFITVANIESRDPDKVRDGNERVVRPRLADAAFFWDSDRTRAARRAPRALKSVTFQAKLGSLYDKTRARRRRSLRASPSRSAPMQRWRAAPRELSKCDLLTRDGRRVPRAAGTDGQVLRAARRRAGRGLRRARGAVLAALRRRSRCRRRATGIALVARRQARHDRRHLRDRPEADRHARSLRPAPRRARRAAHDPRAAARSRSAAA